MSNYRTRGLETIPYSSRDEWLKIRRGYIGGSDAGAIIGLNPWNSAFSVWAEKTGATPEFEGNVRTRVGTELEDFVAHLFMEETGKRVQRINFTLVNPKYPWACANVDREILGEDALLEIKTTSSWDVSKMIHTGGQYPDQWYAQVTHYLAVTGCSKAYIAVLIECRELKIFEVERDESEIDALMQAERYFWETYVMTKRTPPVDGHSATTEAIRQMFPTEGADVRMELPGFDNLFLQRKHLTENQKRIRAEIDAIDNEIKTKLGGATGGKCGNFSVSWRMQKTSALDRDAIRRDYPDIDFSKYATESRVFRVTERKTTKGE